MPPRNDLRPRLTLFAGPNGSGKSTLVSAFHAQNLDLGQLVNADEIARAVADRKGELEPSVNSQWAAAQAAEAWRYQLLEAGVSFTTETVMSDPRWLKFLAAAREAGYHISLYFVTTCDPAINLDRVARRHDLGGHGVAPEKIVQRYHRVMNEMLPKVLPLVDDALLVDNSTLEGGLGPLPVIRLQDGELHALRPTDELPAWALALLG